MSYVFSIMRRLIVAHVAAVLLSAPALAGADDAPVRVAQADCYAIGQRVAAQNGGTLARATLSNQGGQPVCVIVVLVPGKDGQRPRRAEFVVPAN
ncbi:MAG: hypothetical protein M9924_01700 [Rhizobiaceae bacterium]|nr:hypothetical protein [Rhizobiaceae bacterium]